jgi:short-subunit dehydrogenase
VSENGRVLITGASSGIGLALAELVAGAGRDVVLVARRRDRLAALAAGLAVTGVRAETLVADLAELEGIQTVADRLAVGDVEVLVNNAGAGGYAPLATITPEQTRRLWTLNATAPLLLTRAALPHLLERGRGGIVNVASLLAFSAGQRAPYLPARAVYASAKAGNVALSRVLAGELDGTGVQLTLVLPGRVQTEFADGAAQQDEQAMTAEGVARAAWRAFERRETVCIPALGDAEGLYALAEVERALLEGGNRPTVSSHYGG